MKGFFDDVFADIPEHHELLGQQLSNSLIARGLRKTALDPIALSGALTILEDRYSKNEVEKALRWYCTHAGEEFCPEIKTVAQLKLKFPKILKRVTPQSIHPDVLIQGKNIDALATEISTLCGEMIWPEDEKDEEHAWIMQCLVEYKHFKDRVKVLKEENREDLALNHLLDIESDIPNFVRFWVKESHRIYCMRHAITGKASHLKDNLTLLPTVKNNRFSMVVLRWLSMFIGKDRAVPYYFSIKRKLQ